MSILVLPLKSKYFDEIAAGVKVEEYRLCTHFWRKRLEGREFEQIVLTKGYPAKADTARRITRPWLGYVVKSITHPHFGPNPVDVYAINVGGQHHATLYKTLPAGTTLFIKKGGAV